MTTRALKISPELALPADTVTSTLVVYGGKGMGKTNLGSVLMEEIAAARLRFAVVDPMGVWWGLRHDKGGKGKGIEVLILGGTHGDFPLEPTGGHVAADLVVDEAVNVVIDISRRPDGTMWSIGERVRFVRDYSKRLYQRQGERRRPLLQVYDEAARFIPQMIRRNEDAIAECMGAIAVLVEEGRNVGIGVCLITQRSARLNKDVAELADCMIAFRTVGPNSRRAVMDWLGEHVEKGRLKELDTAVRTLPIGSALVVSPGWLEVEKVVRFRARQTFDSSKTPKAGEAEARVSGDGAKPDLAKYQASMAETIEKVKADDPKQLRKQIAELRSALALRVEAEARPSKKSKAIDVTPYERRITQLVDALELAMKYIVEINAQDFFKAAGETVNQEELTKAITTAVERAIKLVDQSVAAQRAHGERLRRDADRLLGKLNALLGQKNVKLAINVRHSDPTPPRSPAPRAVELPGGNGSVAEGLTRPQQRILDALAWFEAVGLPAPEKAPLASMADASSRSSSYGKNVSALRTAGYVEYPQPGLVALTAKGRAIANASDVPGTVEALQQAICAKVTNPQAGILRALIQVHPDSMSKEELAAAAGASAASSSFGNNVSAMRSMGLVDYPSPGRVVARPVLFLDGTGR